jgi:hypothetical protein
VRSLAGGWGTRRRRSAEPRSLAELAAAQANLDPGRHLRELTTELVTIGDRLAQLEHQPGLAEANHLRGEAPDDLRARRAALRAELAAERQASAIT